MHVIGAHDYDHGRLEQNVYNYFLSRDYKLIIIVWIRSTDDRDKMRSAGGHELALVYVLHRFYPLPATSASTTTPSNGTRFYN